MNRVERLAIGIGLCTLADLGILAGLANLHQTVELTTCAPDAITGQDRNSSSDCGPTIPEDMRSILVDNKGLATAILIGEASICIAAVARR